MSEKNTAHYTLVDGVSNNPFANATLADIVRQLESCKYRCEAGPLELNAAFIELKRRAGEQDAYIHALLSEDEE